MTQGIFYWKVMDAPFFNVTLKNNQRFGLGHILRSRAVMVSNVYYKIWPKFDLCIFYNDLELAQVTFGKVNIHPKVMSYLNVTKKCFLKIK